MLVIMKKAALGVDLQQVEQFLVENDCDFHQSTGAARIIIGVVGDTGTIDQHKLMQLSGVLDVYRIPNEE